MLELPPRSWGLPERLAYGESNLPIQTSLNAVYDLFGIHGAKGTEPFDCRNAAEPRRQAVVVAS